jgi:hypothetical protein
MVSQAVARLAIVVALCPWTSAASKCGFATGGFASRGGARVDVAGVWFAGDDGLDSEARGEGASAHPASAATSVIAHATA